MTHSVGAGQEGSETVPKKDEFLQANSLPPFLNVVHKFLLTFLSIWGEVDSGTSSESWEIDGIESSVGVEVVKVLVELWNATTKAVNHDKRKSRLLVN